MPLANQRRRLVDVGPGDAAYAVGVVDDEPHRIMAEFGDNTSAGVLTQHAQRYSPNTVLPEPGGATMCNRRWPADSLRWAISTTSVCEGRSLPLNWMSGKL